MDFSSRLSRDLCVAVGLGLWVQLTWVVRDVVGKVLGF